MANTFFGFNTTLNDHAERLGSSPEDIEGLEAEEEYDALNDETFGSFDNEREWEDWEVQHEQLAEIAESSRHSSNIDSYFDRLNEEDKETFVSRIKQICLDENIWSSKDLKNGEKSNKLNTSDSSPKLLPTVSHNEKSQQQVHSVHGGGFQNRGGHPPKLRTVEELERMLINQSKPQPTVIQQQQPPQPQTQQHQQHQQGPAPGRFPPGFPPLLFPPGGPAPWLPPGLVRVLGPHGGRVGPPPPPPGFPVYSPQGFPVIPGHFPFPPPGRMGAMPPPRPPPPGKFNHTMRTVTEQKDEYAGLMSNREKQWLLNIQLLQVNTGTPYFDDYYYTVFKERQAKHKDNSHIEQRGSNHRYTPRNSTEPAPTLNKKTYTPLQFENSLGKLQFGSVTAPRKIIDMDVITLEKESDGAGSARDSRKTKQLLLELEALYTLVLKAEDLQNPLAISNQDKLMELKQKQRIREMDLAPTPEQKQEVLRLLQAESRAPIESRFELLNRVLCALLQDDKLTSFLNIRKGKMLLLRVLPHWTENQEGQLLELWNKILLSVPTVGRRDSVGDNILPKLHPLFKRFINLINMDQILELISGLIEITKNENSRSTPLSHQSKPPLYFILSNKFGISAISSLLHRVDALLIESTSKQIADWSKFLTCLVETLSLVAPVMIAPFEPISEQVISRHAQYGGLTADKKQLLEKTFVI